MVIHLNYDENWAFPLDELDSMTFCPIDDIDEEWLYFNRMEPEVVAVKTVYTSVATNKWYYSLENSMTMNYMNNVLYDNTDYSTTKITSYTNYTSYRKDQPLGVSITCNAKIDSVQLSLRPDMAAEELIRIGVMVSDMTFTAINLIPGQKYYYRAYLKGGNVTRGHFYTLGQVRMIRSDAIENMRDLGGWQTKDGRKLRYGKIFRGGEMDGIHGTHITEEDSILLHNRLDIRLDIDMRSEEERDTVTLSPLGADVKYVHYDVSPYRITYEDYYKAFRETLNILRQGHSAYLHCWKGADRTGTLVYLMEALLGIPEEDICKDYELTSLGGQLRSRNSTSFLALYDKIQTYPGADLQEKVQNIFLRNGITKEEIAEFKTLMLE
ncbi:MAG: tyrosine-protein phosphatase [Bacteroidaceae bacterium]|nr:tyrosine-protein phosphatase [Bacteroidaceae bacterium]